MERYSCIEDYILAYFCDEIKDIACSYKHHFSDLELRKATEVVLKKRGLEQANIEEVYRRVSEKLRKRAEK